MNQKLLFLQKNQEKSKFFKFLFKILFFLRKKKIEKSPPEIVKPGMKSIEIQTDPMEAILMMDTGSQVFFQPVSFVIDNFLSLMV